MAISVIQPQDNRISRYRILFREIRASAFIVSLFIIFLALAIIVHASGTLSVDLWVTHTVQKVESGTMDAIANFFTNVGNFGVLIAATVITAGFLAYFKKYKSAAIALASLLSYPLNVAIKNLIDRTRPTSALVQVISPAGGFSFPSGHAMISLTVYGTIAYLIWVYIRSDRRALIVVVTTLLNLFIGFSRIYLGVHWFTDVIGGWVAALFLLAILIQIHKKLTAPAVLPPPTVP